MEFTADMACDTFMAGNLLDNAIEAAKQCTHGSVHVALHIGAFSCDGGRKYMF